MSYLPGYNSNVRNIVLYFNRCNLPEYNKLESLRALRPDPCPICNISPTVVCESQCAGHGEYYEYIYIRCGSCGLSFQCKDYNSVSVWNRLSFLKGGLL